MDKRSLFYWSREYAESLSAGQDYADLPDVIAINIVNYEFLPAGGFHTCFHLREDNLREMILTEALEIHFLDMVKWRREKGYSNLSDPLRRWLALFNERSPPELIDEVKKMDNAIKRAYERMVYVTGNKEAIRAYEMRQLALSEATSITNSAIRRGMAEGESNSKMEIARKLKSRGRPLEEIAEVTGLSPEAVEKL